MLIDTHCHLTYPQLASQLDAVLERARQAGVPRVITIATSVADAREALGLLERYPQLAMAAGIHPHEAGKATAEDLAALRALHDTANRPLAGSTLRPPLADATLHRPLAGATLHRPLAGVTRVVAVGETGLDFHYDFAPRDVQERVFREQLQLACDVGKPVVIHARQGEQRVLDVLADFPRLAGRVVFHCYSGGPELARRILDAGCWISFTGVVTFKNAGEIQAAARLVPDDRVMVETDAPYLAPEPHRKVRPNEPALMIHTARFLAALRGQACEDFARQTTANAERFFGLAPE